VRRPTIAVIIVVAAVGAGGPASAFAPSDAPPAPVCTISDSRVTEVSGLVATANGYVAINDSNLDRSKVKVFTLDGACKVTGSVNYPSTARDPEDLAMARDGTLWVADIGDNSTLSGGSGNRRGTIALCTLPPGGKQLTIHRFVYPDGLPRDAETLLISGDGTPVIVTKEPAGEVYVPDGPIQNNNTTGVKLRRVGTFTPAKTGTPNPLGFLGVELVTGGAVSPDGRRAVVRTMADAYEFDVPDGDVAKAITTGTPRITPLPNEPQGESISYTPDGRSFLTASDQDGPTTILRYTPIAPAAAPASPTAAAAASTEPSNVAAGSELSLTDLTRIVVGAGVVGFFLFLAGLVAIGRSRARGRR
jgi:hypothetical protein